MSIISQANAAVPLPSWGTANIRFIWTAFLHLDFTVVLPRKASFIGMVPPKGYKRYTIKNYISLSRRTIMRLAKWGNSLRPRNEGSGNADSQVLNEITNVTRKFEMSSLGVMA